MSSAKRIAPLRQHQPWVFALAVGVISAASGLRGDTPFISGPMKASGGRLAAFCARVIRLPRLTRNWVVCLPCAVALAAAHPALASPHVFSFAITGSGSSLLSNPSGVAIDNSTGASAHDIYVADPQNFRIEKFTPQGSFLLMFGKAVNKTKVEEGKPESEQDICVVGEICQAGTSGEAPGSFSEPYWLAVDSSGGPSAGDVYVADYGDRLISKFTSTGHLVSTWQTDGELNISADMGGITVDRAGNLLVEQATGPASILEYNENGSLVSSFQTPSHTGRGIAVDSSTNVYMATDQGSVEKYSSSGTDLGSLETGIPAALTINPSNDTVYVDEASPDEIKEFSASCTLPNCTPIASFGEGDLDSASYQVRGVAVDGSDETVYVSNPSNTGHEGVAVFLRAGIVPEVTTGASQPGHPNIVTGDVDPANAGIVTGCKFEFIDTKQFQASGYANAKSTPCTPAPPYLTGAEVRAELPGIQPSTDYLYRLVASNTHGQGTGTDKSFESLGWPGAITESASSVHETSVTVSGTVRAQFGEAVTGCMFEYVDQTYYSATGYANASAAPCSPAPPYLTDTSVSAGLSNLKAGTTYHYRVTTANVERSSIGSDGEFTTPRIQPTGGSEEEGSVHEVLHHGPVRCSKRACSRTLRASMRVKSWASSRFPLSYGTTFSVYVRGRSLPVSDLAEHCVGTFRGRGLLATLDECSGRFRLIYLGSGPFRIRWRVFP